MEKDYFKDRTKESTSYQAIHPRGQKIKGVDAATGENLVGRVVYLTENGNRIITTNGNLTVSEWYRIHQNKNVRQSNNDYLTKNYVGNFSVKTQLKSKNLFPIIFIF